MVIEGDVNEYYKMKKASVVAQKIGNSSMGVSASNNGNANVGNANVSHIRCRFEQRFMLVLVVTS
jgi:hypothetical protein